LQGVLVVDRSTWQCNSQRYTFVSSAFETIRLLRGSTLTSSSHSVYHLRSYVSSME